MYWSSFFFVSIDSVDLGGWNKWWNTDPWGERHVCPSQGLALAAANYFVSMLILDLAKHFSWCYYMSTLTITT